MPGYLWVAGDICKATTFAPLFRLLPLLLSTWLPFLPLKSLKLFVLGSEVLCLYRRFSERLFLYLRASLVAQRLKCLPAMWETWVRSLGQEDNLEKEMATHSSFLAWRIPQTEEPGRLHGVARVFSQHLILTKPYAAELIILIL